MGFDNSFDAQDLDFSTEGPDPRDDPYYGQDRPEQDRTDESWYDAYDLAQEKAAWQSYLIVKRMKIFAALIPSIKRLNSKSLSWYFN